MLRIHQSHRVEQLADRLAATLLEDPLPPMEPEVVVVHGAGMARWLSLRLAERLGVCANVDFPFPASFIWDCFRRNLEGLPERRPFDPAELRWRILRLLPDLLPREEFTAPRKWVEANPGQLRLMELSRRLADLYDQYLVYRPDWISAWEGKPVSAQPAALEQDSPVEQDPDYLWQGALWRAVVKEADGAHRVELHRRLGRLLDERPVAALDLPRRVTLFCIADLPQQELLFFSRLAQSIPVDCFVLDPLASPPAGLEPLVSCDARRRDFLLRLREAGAVDEAGEPAAVSVGRPAVTQAENRRRSGSTAEVSDGPADRGMLRCLQDLMRGECAPNARECTVLDDDQDDPSLQVHVCHSRLRELEVLTDRLLALFDKHPEIGPGDVLVTTPDIEAYAPLVEAVFDSLPENRRIPYSIMGRRDAPASSISRAFLRLLELPGGRWTAVQVLTLLEVPAVARSFGIVESELPRIAGWIADIGVRWGIDAEHRVRQGLPGVEEHTWSAGLDRLMLGGVFGGDNRTKIAGILPFPAGGGDGADLLGRLGNFCEELFELEQQLGRERSIRDWRSLLLRIQDRFFRRDACERGEPERLSGALNHMADTAESAGYHDAVTLELLREELRRLLETTISRRGSSIDGRLVFSSMVSLRGVPAKVLCLLGLDDGVFPRPSAERGLDLASRRPRRGDRSPRDEDRGIFLDALAGAEDVLYLSYVGKGLRENNEIPPSVLLSDLLDVLRSVLEQDEQGLPRGVITQHRLQAFSPQYFRKNEENLFSFDTELCRAAAEALKPRDPPGPITGGPLPDLPPEHRSVSLESLLRFFEHPGRALLRDRLGIRLREAELGPDEREPFTLDELQRYHLREELLEGFLRGEDERRMLDLARAKGLLPHGPPGDLVYHEAAAESRALADAVGGALQGVAIRDLESAAVDLELGGFHLSGRLGGLSRRGLTAWGSFKLKGKRRGSFWIRNLLLQVLEPKDVPPRSLLLARDGSMPLSAVEDSAAHLVRLLEIYWKGLHGLLPWAPGAGWAYAKTLAKSLKLEGPQSLRGDTLEGAGAEYDAARSAAREAALKEWRGGFMQRGESEDPWYRLAFGESEPMRGDTAQRFGELAEAISLPALLHCLEDE